MDIAHIAATTVISLAPFMPYLLKATAVGGKKLVEVLAEKGGEAAWNKAQELWKKIESKLGDDAEIKGAAMMISANPTEEDIQKLMIKRLTSKFASDPDLAQEVLKIIGGENVMQSILIGNDNLLVDVVMEGGGKKTLTGGNRNILNDIKMISH